MPRRMYSGNAKATTLNGAITSTQTNITVDDATGYPSGGTGNFWIVIDRGLSTEEKVLCSNTTGLVITAVDRTVAGNRDDTSNQSHSNGATVEHCYTADDANDANAHTHDDTRDDHSQYLKTDGTRVLTGVSAIAAIAGASAPGDVAAKGSGPTLALSDHVHGRETLAALQALVIPVCTIWATGADNFETGWALCDGSELVGATYPAAAAELGTGASSRFGAAAVGSFKLPDYRQKFPMGKAASGTGSTLGGTGGTKDAVVATHGHANSFSASTGGEAGHTHSTGDGGALVHSINGAAANQMAVLNAPSIEGLNTSPTATRVTFTNMNDHAAHNHGGTGAGSSHAHTTTLSGAVTDAGVSGTDANLPPFQACNYMMKVH